MLKKPCPCHNTSVNHTLKQCDMLKTYYSRAATKDGEAKKDGGDGDARGFLAVENIFLIFGGPTVDMSNNQRKREQYEVLTAENAPPSFLDWSEDAITSVVRIIRTTSSTQASTRWLSTQSSATRGSPMS
jgi:hypothetical protein